MEYNRVKGLRDEVLREIMGSESELLLHSKIIMRRYSLRKNKRSFGMNE